MGSWEVAFAVAAAQRPVVDSIAESLYEFDVAEVEWPTAGHFPALVGALCVVAASRAAAFEMYSRSVVE